MTLLIANLFNRSIALVPGKTGQGAKAQEVRERLVSGTGGTDAEIFA